MAKNNKMLDSIKCNISSIESAKNAKRQRLKGLYYMLTDNEELLDVIMIQIGKDIEEKFPGVKYRIMARIKSPESFDAKVKNDLMGLRTKQDIEKVNIYDIIALSIIIEDVPDTVKANDSKFDEHIKELINMRNQTRGLITQYEGEIKEDENREEQYKKGILMHTNQLKENEKIIERIKALLEQDSDNEELNYMLKYLMEMETYINENILDLQKRISEIEEEIGHKKETTIRRTKERLERENNDCNQVLADYIVTNMDNFDNMKILGVKSIPERLKQKENYDGYKATHNCFEMEIELDTHEKVKYLFETQGKSKDAFYIADRGKAAKYHINQSAQPGKIVKEKVWPEIESIGNEEDREKFRRKVKRTVPRYRIYQPPLYSQEEREELIKKGENVNKGSVYKLSEKECFMVYYYNQLVGNKKIGVDAHPEGFKKLVKGRLLRDDDGSTYQL